MVGRSLPPVSSKFEIFIELCCLYIFSHFDTGWSASGPAGKKFDALCFAFICAFYLLPLLLFICFSAGEKENRLIEGVGIATDSEVA